jgi:hypothetical protein
MGLSGRAIMTSLCAGELDPKHLAQLMQLGVHASQDQVIAALTTEVREHHRFLLQGLLMPIDAQDRAMKLLATEIEQHLTLLRNKCNAAKRSMERVAMSYMCCSQRSELISHVFLMPSTSAPERASAQAQRKCRQATKW